MKGLLFTYALTYGGAIVSLLNPFYGFLIYVIFAILKPDALWFYSVPMGTYSRTVAVAFLIGWLLHGTGSWSFGRAKGPMLALIFFWGWLVLQSMISPNQTGAWSQLVALSKTFLPLVAGVTLIKTIHQLKLLAWVIVLSQGFLAYEANMQYYTTVLIPNDWKFINLDNNSTAINMVSAVGVAFFLGMHSQRWWQKLIAFAAAALMSHVVLFSMSRGGMLALGVTGLAAFVLIPKRPIHFLGFAAACLLILRLAGPSIQHEFFSTFADQEQLDTSAAGHFQLTWDALDCMLRNPLLGCGLENWGNMAVNYGWPRGKEAHSTWAQLGAELGVPGLAAILSFYGLGCWQLLKLKNEKRWVPDPWVRYLARMVVASIAGFFVAAAGVTVEGLELPYYIMALGAGTLKLYSAELERATAKPISFSRAPFYYPAADQRAALSLPQVS